MSIFSTPDEWVAEIKRIEKMNKDMTRLMPPQLSSAANLMVHPMAGAAAMSALSIGLASHAFGIWLGALSSAAEASQRLLGPLAEAIPDVDAFSAEPKTPATRARAAAETLIADVQSKANETTEAATEIVTEAEQDVQEAEQTLIEPTSELIESPQETAQETPAAEPVIVDAPALVGIMPEDFRQPKSLDKPAAPDDLKSISGIGPKLESVLNGLGVWTFSQIAGWKPEEIAWVDDYLSFKGRIGRDGWIEQAARLAGPVKSVH